MRLVVSFVLAVALFVTAGPAMAQRKGKPESGIVRVRLVTTEGPIVLALDARRAPETTRNFLAYVDDRRLDGVSFYRTARRKSAPKLGFIQAGIRTDARRLLPPFPHEPTTKTGIKHLDATISMARRQEPGSAGGNFFITVGAMPSMDARPGHPGYAAFGRIAGGMDVVRRILAKPTKGGAGAMAGQMLAQPVRILSARRIDGAARPTGRVKPWLIDTGRRK